MLLSCSRVCVFYLALLSFLLPYYCGPMQGAAGFPGFPGFKGSAGTPGKDGDKGPSGLPGLRGDTGPKVRYSLSAELKVRRTWPIISRYQASLFTTSVSFSQESYLVTRPLINVNPIAQFRLCHVVIIVKLELSNRSG